MAPHVHIVMQFKNQQSLRNLAKIINESQVSSFVQWKGDVNNAYSYLIHRTNDAIKKFQYPVDAVKANFDYTSLIQIIEEVIPKRKVNPKQQLDNLHDGLLSKEEALNSLSGSQLAIYKKQIEIVEQQKKKMKLNYGYRNEKTAEEKLKFYGFMDNLELEKHFLPKVMLEN